MKARLAQLDGDSRHNKFLAKFEVRTFAMRKRKRNGVHIWAGKSIARPGFPSSMTVTESSDVTNKHRDAKQ